MQRRSHATRTRRYQSPMPTRLFSLPRRLYSTSATNLAPHIPMSPRLLRPIPRPPLAHPHRHFASMGVIIFFTLISPAVCIIISTAMPVVAPTYRQSTPLAPPLASAPLLPSQSSCPTTAGRGSSINSRASCVAGMGVAGLRLSQCTPQIARLLWCRTPLEVTFWRKHPP